MTFYPSAESCQIKDLDKLFEEYFGQTHRGMFVDVGSYNGYDFSNVWGLAEEGWNGICYEPVPSYAVDCTNNHRKHGHKVETICCAVGDVDGVAWLYEGGVDSTIDDETVSKSPFGFTYDVNKRNLVGVTKLDTSLMARHVVHCFDLISIDVEGAELQVLGGFDLNMWQPKMIIIETHVGINGKDYHAQAIIDQILSHGYNRINDDALNTIFWMPQRK